MNDSDKSAIAEASTQPFATRSETVPDPRRPWVWPWFLGALELLLSMTMTLWLLTSPALFRLYYPALHISPYSDDAGAILDWLASDRPERSADLVLIHSHLTEKELKHYSDVRHLFRSFPRVAGALATVTALLVVILRADRRIITAARRRGTLLWIILALATASFAWWDWKAFFAWVHHPFFGDKSWRLADDAYSLRLFPAAFWRFAVAPVILAPLVWFGTTGVLLRIISSSSAGGATSKRPAGPEGKRPTTL